MNSRAINNLFRINAGRLSDVDRWIALLFGVPRECEVLLIGEHTKPRVLYNQRSGASQKHRLLRSCC
jgi:hypothetical protein